MARKQPKISVIICAFTMERLKDTAEAVESLVSQTVKPDEILVSVDNNEELYDRLRASLPVGVKIIKNDRVQGVSETRNIAIREASGDIIAFIDDDAVASNDWLETLVKSLQRDHVSVVGGRCDLLWSGGYRPGWFPEELDWIVGGTYKGLPLQGNEVRNVSTCNMALTRGTLESVGYFNSEIGAVNGKRRGGEEAEFCLKIKSKLPEKLIWYEPEAAVQHKVNVRRSTLGYVLRRSYQEGASKARLQVLSSSRQPLSVEASYLNYLLFKAIPERLKRFYKKNSLLQWGVIMMSIIATGAGYATGKIRG